MDNIFTTQPTAEEAAQIQVMLDETLAEMKRIRQEIDSNNKEIAASQARTDVIWRGTQEIISRLRRR